MASIDFDSELLKQPLHEKTLSGVLYFRAVCDKSSNPVIFSALRDGSLLLLAQDTKGTVTKTDLSKSLNLPSGEKVTALAVSQSSTRDVYLAFASGIEGQASTLWIFPPVTPNASEAWWTKFTKANACTGPTTGDGSIVSQFLLAPKVSDDEGANYPFLAALKSQPGVTSTKDVARIAVDSKAKTWNWATDLTYPYNLDDLKDYCVGVLPAGYSGIFGLDTTQGKNSVTFVGIKRETNSGATKTINVELPVVSNAKSLATTLDTDGYTNLLVGGDGILHIGSQDAADSKHEVKAATLTDKSLSGVRKMLVAQNGRKCAIWSINSDDNLIGCSATLKMNDDNVDEISLTGSPVPLLPATSKLQTFDAVNLTNPMSHEVFALSREGSVTHLQQLGDASSWTERKFLVPEVDDVQDVVTYTCHVKVKKADKTPAANTKIRMTSSSIVSCIVEGGRISLSPTATEVKTNAQGVIAMTLPAPGLKVPNITVTLPAASGNDPNQKDVSATFNAADKAVQKLATTAKAGTLGSVQKSDGSKLFPGITDQANTIISQLGDKYSQEAPRGRGTGTTATSDTTIVANVSAVRATDAGDVIDELGWDLWHGIVSGVEVIKSIAYSVGEFIITTAEGVWKFVVRTVENILDAIAGLLKLIETAIEDALVWLASQFDWSGVLDTMTVFDELLDTGMAAVQTWVADGGKAVDDKLAQWEGDIKKLHFPPTQPDQLKFGIKQGDGEDKSTTYSGNPMFHWAGQHAESSSSPQQHGDDSETEAILLEFFTIFTDTFEKTYAKIKDTTDQVWNDLKTYLNNDGKSDWFSCLANVGTDVLAAVIGCVRLAVKALFKSITTFLSWLNKLLNKKLDVWVLTKLFSKITGGKALTVKHLASLLLAVPTWFVLNLATGKNPRDFPAVAEFLKEVESRPPHLRAMTVMSVRSDRTEDGLSSSSSLNRSTALESKDDNDDRDNVSITTVAVKSDAVSASTASTTSDTLDKVLHVSQLIRNTALFVFSCIDMPITAVAWMSAGAGAGAAQTFDPPWRMGARIVATILVSTSTFPWPIHQGSDVQSNLRFATWNVVSSMNLFKCFLPGGPAKATMSGIIALFDIALNAAVWGIQTADHDLDDAGLILGRVLAVIWAGGSCYNGWTKGAEEIGFWITVGDGSVLIAESFIVLASQFSYAISHFDDKDYKLPALAHSLSGSQS